MGHGVTALRCVAVIQARLGSTRLPGKALLDVAGRPMLSHVIERARAIPGVDGVVLATTVNPLDDALVDFARRGDIPWVRGSENDVLDRFHVVVTEHPCDVIVRVTPDCPLLDPRVSGLVLAEYLRREPGVDYASNVHPPTYPDGLDTEIFSRDALERAWREAALASDREHVTPYIWKNPDRFRLVNVTADADRSGLRWTVDEKADLEFVRAVYARLGAGAIFGLDDVLALLRREPALADINTGFRRNEGYAKSVSAEGIAMGGGSKRSLARSEAWFRRAEKVIPSCTQTFSKGHTQFVHGVAPLFLARGKGSHVWDVDGNEYVDYPMALGPIVLGYDDPDVNAAVIAQVADGVTFSLSHPLEVEVAELLTEIVPCAEMVRFGKNGSDATSGAVRAARAFTDREMIACCGYHGWQDWYIGTTTRHRGVPRAVRELTRTFQYNDAASLESLLSAHPGQFAAVIMEPVGVIEPRDGFLERVAELTRAHGAVLIYDEIVTGFRIALGGAQERFRVTPDLACFGKAMANGYPLSAVVGRRDVMQVFDEIFFSFTLGGEAVSLAAARATMTKLSAKNVIEHLWRQGARIRDGYNRMAKAAGLEERTRCIGLAPRTVVTFTDATGTDSLAMKSLWQQEMIKRGILVGAGFNICYAHGDDDVEATLAACGEALSVLARAVADRMVETSLEGPVIQPVFRQA